MPPAAPTVQSLSDIVSGIQAAQQPEVNQINTEEAQNDQSGAAQTNGLNAAQTTAFGNIENTANAKGLYFSGFSPDAEAKYTASTYLPQLAKLQATIAATRGTLEGQKATLATDANTEGQTQETAEQDQLNSYNNSQATAAATAAAAAAKDQTSLEAAEIKAGSSGSSSAPSPSTIKAQAEASLQSDVVNALNGIKSKGNGYTESTILPTLIQAYAGTGVTAADISKAVYSTRKTAYGF